MRKRSTFTLLVLVLGTVAAQIPEEGEEAILEEEVQAPELDWQDEGWMPLYLHYEDPASVECGGRQACMEALGNATEAQ